MPVGNWNYYFEIFETITRPLALAGKLGWRWL